ncbi:MAG TPA: L,D-transpeptidase family protein [Cytophagaceae bacterium]|nr:L,D-transpeptidase family protein [Cytophagaceae bacterium]
MKTTVFLIVLLFFNIEAEEFKSAQLRYARVKEAYQEKEESLRALYIEKGLDFNKQSIFLRVFKREKTLELWVKSSGTQYVLLKSYAICSASGDLGPKRKMGDYQVPEGFYHIDRFNPQSNFFLSLGLNYPNASDKVLSDKQNPGGDIFIHGNCVSIGCMAMTDSKIKEIYLVAVEAKNNGQINIPVHIFPFKMTDDNMHFFNRQYKEEQALFTFWQNLKQGYDYFEKNKKVPIVSVNTNGNYFYK